MPDRAAAGEPSPDSADSAKSKAKQSCLILAPTIINEKSVDPVSSQRFRSITLFFADNLEGALLH